MDEFLPEEYVELPCQPSLPPTPVAPRVSESPHGRGKGRFWILIDEFTDRADAFAALPKDDYALCSRTKTEDGDKEYYRCRRDKECPYQRFLLYPSYNLNFNLYESGKHVHLNPRKKYGIDIAVKEHIKECLSYGVKTPKGILAVLRRDNLTPLPTATQIRNFVANQKKGNNQNTALTLSRLISLCQRYNQTPTLDDEVFILDYSYEIEEDMVNGFQVIFSTRRLLLLSQHAKNIHVDGTYKLVFQGYPVLIIGYSDANRRFHPIALSLSMRERLCDYQKLFVVVSESIRKYYGHLFSYRPNVLISDASSAIKGAFASWYGEGERKEIVCWAHVYSNIDKHKHLCDDKTIRDNILNDVSTLQLCGSPEIFEVASKLFLKKWNSLSSAINFITYIDNSWIKQQATWYEGYSFGNPSTNNCLEATNNNIKREHTLRQKLGFDDFFEVVTRGIVQGWSIDRRDNEKVISHQPTIDIKLWTASYQWSINSSIKIMMKNDNRLIFIGSKNLKKPLKMALPRFTKLLKEKNWKSFDEYKNWTKVIHVLEKNDNDNTYRCSCAKHMKEYTCKHAVGVLLRLGMLEAPDTAKNVPIGEKRKRGRPGKAKAALIRE